MYDSINALKRGEAINYRGFFFKKAKGDLKAGDLFLAERNIGPLLLTAEKVVMAKCGCCIDFVVPTTSNYSYNGHECVKVEEVQQ